MSVLIMECPVDGLVPVDSPVLLSPDSGGVLHIEVQMPCPLCRRMVSSLASTMHPDGQVDVEITDEQLSELREAYEWATSASAPPVEIVSRVMNVFQSISPVLPRIVSAMASKKGVALAGWVGIVIAAAGLCIQIVEMGDRPDEQPRFSVEEIERLYEVFERSQGGAPTPQSQRFPMPVGEQPEPGSTENP